ncbi:large ribosomal subunit protein P1-like [Capricornis sumatraensis]|uniref:large ribosomal subunit protein P1-like n=1 Tax=Capricornis sumatraensis TaxID=34865 RepID=UPI003604D0E1
MVQVLELACIHLALILHNNEVMLLALAYVNIRSLICIVGADGPILSTTAAPAEEKNVEAKKEESEESDDDMAFGLFD